MNAVRVRYVVKVISFRDARVLVDYGRDHYGILSVADLLKECEGGLQQIVPAVDNPIHVEITVARYGG